MKKKMNIFLTIPGIEICIIMLISFFMPLVSFNSEKYTLYSGIKMLLHSDESISVECSNKLDSLRIFIIVALLLTVITIISYIVIGSIKAQFMVGGIISVFSAVCILIMEFVNYSSIKGSDTCGISTKSGFLFIMFSSLGMIIYVIVMCAVPDKESKKSDLDTGYLPESYNQIKQKIYDSIEEKPIIYHDIGKIDSKEKGEIQPTVYGSVLQGIIIGVEGTFKGASIRMQPGESIVVGRDPNQCHLVLESLKVSRKHCVINMDSSGAFISIKCYSPNGLFFSDGRHIDSGETLKLTDTVRIILSNGEEVLEVV